MIGLYASTPEARSERRDQEWRENALGLCDWDTSIIERMPFAEAFIRRSLAYIGVTISTSQDDQPKLSEIKQSRWKRAKMFLFGWIQSRAMLVSIVNAYVSIHWLIFGIILPDHLNSIDCLNLKNATNAKMFSELACHFEYAATRIPMDKVSKLFYAFLLVNVSLGTLMLIRKTKKTPVCLMAMSFVVDPKHHFDQLDDRIRHLLDRFEQSMHNFGSETLNISQERNLFHSKFRQAAEENHRKPSDFEGLNLIMRMLEDNWRQLYRYQTRDLVALRPYTYRIKSYKHMRTWTMFTVFPLDIFLQFCGIINTLSIYFAVLFECDMKANCHLREPDIKLRTPDYLIAFEFFLSKISIQQVVIAITMVFWNCQSFNMSLFTSAVREMRVSLQLLQRMLEYPELVAAPRGLNLNLDEKFSLMATKIQANKLLFATNIKLEIYNVEIRSNMANSKFILEIIMITMGSVVFIGVILEFFAEGKERMLRLCVLAPCWIFANSAAIHCAHYQSEVSKLQNLCFSVMSRTTQIYSDLDDGSRIWRPTAGMGFAGFLWFRFVRSIDCWRMSVIPKPISIQMNYRKILEFNFFIISILTIIYAR